ncbi:hypothetical protein EJ03DRAFT_354077 [Teratosphaeria nubilosa]|uniref:Uncharacterized protein n=1 Tax=Teratosphaeria nubilosa TaxID=161662 RepID=A0A6G1L0M3_9PEZI|nr:hypothetical protein EJ03DRAFT_354077 [Teratosphaeria nubilosa]
MGFILSIFSLLLCNRKDQQPREKLCHPSGEDRSHSTQHDSGDGETHLLSDEDHATANEEVFDMTDVEDANFAAHLQGILTNMRLDPGWLPPTSNRKADPNRYEWHCEKIEFNEKIFEQR